MFIEERHKKILELLEHKKRIEVPELCEFFAVSVDTIRRDLRILDEKGLLQKTYGGAIWPEKTGTTYSLEERKQRNTEEKKQIAAYAARFVADGDTIFLESSTTVMAMIHHIQQLKNLTIFTNCIITAQTVITVCPDCTLYMIGGLVHKSTGNTCSPDTLETLKNLHVDKVFSGLCSIHSDWGFSTPNIWEAPILKAVFELGKAVYFLADSSKFEKKASYKVCGFSKGQTIITDPGLGQDIYEKYVPWFKHGLSLQRVWQNT